MTDDYPSFSLKALKECIERERQKPMSMHSPQLTEVDKQRMLGFYKSNEGKIKMKRKPDETFETYKRRRKMEQLKLKKHMKGKLAWNSGVKDINGDKSYRKKKVTTETNAPQKPSQPE